MSSKYKAGVDCINKKNYSEAKKILSEIIKDKSDKDMPIALGAMGYCLYKEKNYYGARKYFENKAFLKSSQHHDFQRYVIIWATTYFNQGLYEHLENIIISLKYCDTQGKKKGPKVNESLYLLKDKNGNKFDEQHPVVMFIKGLIKWKIEKRLGEAECLIKNSRIEVGKVFLDKVQKEKKILDEEISKSINASKLADFSINYAETILKSSDQNEISIAQDYLKKRIESGTEGLEEEKLLLARSYAQNKNLELALTLYTQIAENYKQKSHGDETYKKKTAELYVEMAKYCLESDDKNYSLKCREYLTEADNLLPSLNEISLLLGDYFYQSGNFKEAYKSFYRYKALHEMDDPSLDTRIYLAHIELSEGGVIKDDFPDIKDDFVPGGNDNPNPIEFLQEKPDEEKLKEFDYIKLNEKMIGDRDLDTIIKKDIKKSEDLREDCENVMKYGGYDKPFIYYEKAQMNLYDYLHKGITDDFDKEEDDIKYFQKIRIIQQIADGMLQYLKGTGNSIYNLSPYNVYIMNFQNQSDGKQDYQIPIIKVGFLTNKVLIPEDLSYQEKIWKYGTHESSLYSLAVLIWEIFTRKIPFEGYKNAKTAMEAYNYFQKEKLSTEGLLSNIPLEIYDFFYKIMNKQNGLALTNDSDIIKKLLNEIQEFPNYEFIPKETDVMSRDVTNIHFVVDNYVSRF
ncbi:MAG: hypothetical protein MJ252_26325, partial [archaeon]|nr:hypothetical protein [archaeon]